jgi:hypothetical protein
MNHRDRWHRGSVFALLGVGVLVRVVWAVHRPEHGAAGEAENVAVAIGQGLGIADAYRLGQGPTAHLLPISPGIAGLVYRALGVRAPFAEALLTAWAIVLCLGAYFLLYRLFAWLGTPGWARLAALATACLAPTYLGTEAVDFRVWEGGLAVCLSAAALWLIVAVERGMVVSWPVVIGGSLLLSLACFVNPLLGGALFLCAGIVALRRLRPIEIVGCATASLVFLGLMIGGWAARNQQMMGSPIPLRSNAGLELAIGLYAGELQATDRRAAFLARLDAVHPARSEGAYRRMVAAGGEVAYARQLGIEAKAWARTHPGEALRLMALHLGQTVTPQAWQFQVFGSGAFAGLRALIASFAGLGGCLGIAAAVALRRPAWAYPALFMGLLLVLSSPFQPAVRYTFLIYPLGLFAAWDLVAGIAGRFADRKDQAA